MINQLKLLDAPFPNQTSSITNCQSQLLDRLFPGNKNNEILWNSIKRLASVMTVTFILASLFITASFIIHLVILRHVRRISKALKISNIPNQ